MDPITIISILSQFAPAILKHFGAGASAVDVASKAIAIAKDITGKPDDAGAVAVIQNDPVAAAAFQKAVMDQEAAFEQMYVGDLQNARARDIALSTTPKGNVRANWLMGVAILTIFACGWTVVKNPELNEYAKGMLQIILGMYIQNLNQIYAFEFGTTRASQSKDHTIASLSQGPKG